MIKHISFDFWDTLVTSNPEFNEERAKWLSKRYSISQPNVEITIKNVKAWCDQMGIETLTAIPHTTQWLFIMEKLGVGKDSSLIHELNLILYKNFQLLGKCPPTILIPEEVLKRLRGDGKSISITCNTGLLSSNLIGRTFYDKHWLKSYIDFEYWSDVSNDFKPNPLIVELILNIAECSATKPEEILHIGDNLNTDGKLVDWTRMQFVHFDKTKMNYEDIFNHPSYK